jgi:uncharacterized protein YbjQ (UPF0145 family)
MILTTTNTIEGHKIVDYLGIVTGVKVQKGYDKMSFKDSLNQEKYYENMQKQIDIAKEEAFQKISTTATKMKANAIVGIKIDMEINNTSQVILVSVTGTAVKVA